MASKKYKGKTCVYCAVAVSTTGDHVFAREFFPVAQRAGLPKVAACEKCNGEKAGLEHYLTAILPFGGRQSQSAAHLEEMAPPKLAKNARLHRELARGSERVWSREPSGLYVRSLALPFSGDTLHSYLALVVRGLMAHHWQEIIGPDTFVDVLSLTGVGERYFRTMLSWSTDRRVEARAGDIFSYRGAQGIDNRQISIWEFTLLNGLTVAGDGEQASRWGVMTGPMEIEERVNRAVRAQSFLRIAMERGSP